MTSVLRRPRAEVLRDVESSGVVAVVRLADAAAVRDVARALLSGGVRAIEITMTVPRAVEVIAELATSVPSDVLIGAGTVLDSATGDGRDRCGCVICRQPGAATGRD